MIVTVTLNAAIDRTLVVPNFQLGHRHRASVGFPSAGGKGINVARALKRLGAPVVCTGLAGGRTGTLLVEELTNEGILNDFVRIRAESRTSIAVLDPTSNAYTEINEWGPEVTDEELEILREKLAYLAQRRGVRRARGLAPARGRLRFLRRARPRPEPRPAARRRRLGGRAAPARESRPSRTSSRRTSRRRRPSSATSSSTRRISPPASTRSPTSARGTSLITLEPGCYALLREDRDASSACGRRRRGSSPSRRVGAGDTLLAGFLAARVSGKPFEEAVRSAVAAGAASVLEAGAGRFDPREASRLTSLVQLEHLEHVARVRRARRNADVPPAALLAPRMRSVAPVALATSAPCVLASERPSHPGDERRSANPPGASHLRWYDRSKLSVELRQDEIERLLALERKFAKEGLTFDDVLLVPAESGVLPARGLDAHAPDAHDRARDPAGLGRDGHRHRGARWRSRSPARAASASSTATSPSRRRPPRWTR